MFHIVLPLCKLFKPAQPFIITCYSLQVKTFNDVLQKEVDQNLNRLYDGVFHKVCFLAALAALCPPSSLTYWLSHGYGLHNLFQHSASELWPNHTNSYQTIPNFWIFTKFHNFNKISEFWPNFRISTKLQNFD